MLNISREESVHLIYSSNTLTNCFINGLFFKSSKTASNERTNLIFEHDSRLPVVI